MAIPPIRDWGDTNGDERDHTHIERVEKAIGLPLRGSPFQADPVRLARPGRQRPGFGRGCAGNFGRAGERRRGNSANQPDRGGCFPGQRRGHFPGLHGKAAILAPPGSSAPQHPAGRFDALTPDQQELLNKSRDSIRAGWVLMREGFPSFAASRAYYAMFYAAQALLEGEGLSFSRHSAVIAAFGRHFAKTNRLPAEFHRYLLDAMTARHEGDYAPSPTIGADDARVHLERAEEFLEKAEGFLS